MILVLINLIFRQLPTGIRQVDVSAEQLYTLGEVSREVTDALEQDVEILLVAESGNIDLRIEQLAENYAAASPHTTTRQIDPEVHPPVLTTYDTEENSVVVACEDTGKSRSIPFTDIILYDTWSYYYYGYLIETEFDGEGLITSALDYVVSDNTKQIYLLQGHGESDLDEVITDSIAKQNMDLSELNLLLAGEIPADCDAILCVAPTKDLADDELSLRSDYIASGGNLYLILEADASSTPNLNALMEEGGIENESGYVGDLERYYQNNPYYVFPLADSSNEITQSYSEDDLALFLYPTGLSLLEDTPDNVTSSAFLTTSGNGLRANEEDYETGTYVLGAASVITGEREDADGETVETEGHLVVVSSSSLVDASIISAFSNVENLNLFMDSLTWFFDDVATISIEARSLEITYNTVLGGGVWSGLYLFVIPGALLIVGLVVWLRRRKA